MKYFKLSEFEKDGYKISDEIVKYNFENLVDNVLDKLREYYGAPIYVLEGYNPSNDFYSIGVTARITTKSKQGNINIFEFLKSLEFDEAIVYGDYESIIVSYYPKNRKKLTQLSNATYLSDYLVCIESGHGKDVAGKRSPDSQLLEWEWAREIKYRVVEELENQKICRVFDVNPEDTEPGLTVRANRANNAWKDNNKKGIFVSVHVNAAGHGQWMNARGWSIYTSKGQTEADKLADSIWLVANEVFPPMGLTMRKDLSDGDYDIEANFTVLVKTSMPAVLIENFFMDNKEDMKFLLSEKGKSAIIDVIVKGIKNYLLSKK